ncbi:MAG: hypothetical protein OZ919_00410 [Xanthomonadaceae bacterium]|nr:hypothetical protein [Xanthomonadaceae bacterium]
MKSRNVLAAAVAVVLLCGAPLAVQAQQAPIKVVLKNVPALPGATGDAVGTVDGDPQQKAAIPLIGTEAKLDSHGNIVVDCLTTNGDCPNIGAGGGAITGIPTLSFTVPSATVALGDTSTRLQWTTTNADACYGVQIEKKSATGAWAPYTGTGSSAWSKEWPANGTASTGFALGSLERSATAGVETEYRFTLRCYSKTVGDVGGTDVVAIQQAPVSGIVKLASSTGTPLPGGSDYCSEYYPAGHPARSAPGFSVPTNVLQPVIVQFPTVFAGGDGSGPPVSFLDVFNNGTPGRGAFAGPHAGPGKYMSIPIDIPANAPAATGLWFSWIEPQNFQGMSHSLKNEVSISPCQGDFRAAPVNNASSDLYDRAQCRTTGTGLTASTGTLSGSNGYCFLKPGARMYINVTNHSLDAYRATGAPPVWGCDAGVTNCGKKADVRRSTDG